MAVNCDYCGHALAAHRGDGVCLHCGCSAGSVWNRLFEAREREDRLKEQLRATQLGRGQEWLQKQHDEVREERDVAFRELAEEVAKGIELQAQLETERGNMLYKFELLREKLMKRLWYFYGAEKSIELSFEEVGMPNGRNEGRLFPESPMRDKIARIIADEIRTGDPPPDADAQTETGVDHFAMWMATRIEERLLLGQY